MSLTAYKWALAFHVIGVILWAGAMIALAFMLSSDEARNSALQDAARKVARVMDMGALVALVCGVYILARTKGFGEMWALKQPWMHIKLTVVALAVIGSHGYLAATLGKLRRGGDKTLPSFVPALVLAATAAVVILAIAKPLAKGG